MGWRKVVANRMSRVGIGAENVRPKALIVAMRRKKPERGLNATED